MTCSRWLLPSKILIISLVFFSFVATACKTSRLSDLKNGDLLFVTAKHEGLSGAINNVSQVQGLAAFDHIGLLEKDKDKYYVLHATSSGGSQRQDLRRFLKLNRNAGQQIFLYRLKPSYRYAIPAAILKAKSMFGKPYNFEYILNENSFYCSDFVERAFRPDSIFKLEPMTFNDPATGQTNTFWKEFYQKRGLQVPEGELGCNPNGLAASEKLIRLKKL